MFSSTHFGSEFLSGNQYFCEIPKTVNSRTSGLFKRLKWSKKSSVAIFHAIEKIKKWSLICISKYFYFLENFKRDYDEGVRTSSNEINMAISVSLYKLRFLRVASKSITNLLRVRHFFSSSNFWCNLFLPKTLTTKKPIEGILILGSGVGMSGTDGYRVPTK